MKFSAFGQKFGAQAGITSLMQDLGDALASGDDLIMMGGGNPAQIPAMTQRFQQRLLQLAQDPAAVSRLIGIYDPPQGDKSFIRSLAALLSRTYGWPVKPENIALTNGSQAAFFMLFNLLAGDDGQPGQQAGRRHIRLPLAPEYIGYADTGLVPDLFVANRPLIHELGDHLFKYQVDFAQPLVTPDTAAICVSRPTNPSGNVLTDAEMQQLHALACQQDIPLIIDGAYGQPFPDLIYVDAKPDWDEQTVLCLSLSKFGLPAVRTGMVIAAAPIIQALSGVNAILNLATGSFGPMLAQDLVDSGDILTISQTLIKPYYQAKQQKAMAALYQHLGDRCPWRMHKPEGAMFLWLWFPGLPISSQQLYQRLKARGVLVVSGHHFFPGLPDDGQWPHRHACIRVTYAQDDAQVAKGLAVLAEEVLGAFELA